MSVRKCKFCGCSERRACALIEVFPAPGVSPYLLPPGIALIPPDAETHIVGCSWLTEEVCTNPACIEKAYLESRELAVAVQGLLDQGLVVISDDGEEQLLLTEEGQFEAGRLRRTA